MFLLFVLNDIIRGGKYCSMYSLLFPNSWLIILGNNKCLYGEVKVKNSYVFLSEVRTVKSSPTLNLGSNGLKRCFPNQCSMFICEYSYESVATTIFFAWTTMSYFYLTLFQILGTFFLTAHLSKYGARYAEKQGMRWVLHEGRKG